MESLPLTHNADGRIVRSAREYEIVFDTSADRNSAQRRYVKVSEARLASKIISLIRQGRIIHEVRRVA